MYTYYDMFIRELKNRNYSLATIKIYGNKIKQYFNFYKQNQITLKDNSLNDKISIFIEKQKGYVAKRQTYSALKLFFKYVLKKNCPYFLDKVKKRKRLPTTLYKNEVLKILTQIKNPIHYLIIAMLYGSGLRVSEVTNLKEGDIDLIGLTVTVKNSKGHKDRITILSPKLRWRLQNIILKKKSQDYLFTTINNKKYSIRTVQHVFKKALIKSNIKKNATCHTLRHSFATYLLYNKINIKTIKNLLGHKSIKTTMVYLHVVDIKEAKVQSPL